MFATRIRSRSRVSARGRVASIIRRLIALVTLCGGAAILLGNPTVWLGLGRAAAAPDEAKPAPADKTPLARAGQLIRISLPITGGADIRIKSAIEKALQKMPADAERTLIFEFAPEQGASGEGTDFSRALSLSQFISGPRLSGVKTVAFLPKSVRGHAALVAMACEELVMAPEAELGDPAADEPAADRLGPAVRSGYFEIADKTRTITPEVALAMLDKNLDVYQIETENTRVFALGSVEQGGAAGALQTVDDVKRKQTVQSMTPLFKPGEPRTFTGRRARALGFAKYLTPDRLALARSLQLPPESVQEDPSLVDRWRPIMVKIHGPIQSGQTASIQKTIEDQIREGDINFVCVWINSPGGSLEDSITLANFLADLDPSKVRTVAYIAGEARGDAALIALACDQIVMQEQSVLGGSGAQFFGGEKIADARQIIHDHICRQKARSWSVPAAMIDPAVRVFRYSRSDGGPAEYFSAAEAQEQNDPSIWTQEEPIGVVGSPLLLRGDKAVEMGVAWRSVDDLGKMRELFGIENELPTPEPGWADVLIDALASPPVGWLLLFIGWVALLTELHSPGVGVGGFVAGVAFLLFFWGRHLGGTATWLEALLFLAGFACILLEIFVLPGTAIFGLGGGAMVILSLVLASQTFVVPHNDYQWEQMGDTLLGLAGSGLAMVIAAALMRHYLPRTPVLNNVLLEPPTAQEMAGISLREAMVDFSALLGQVGVTTTPLVPSGKARFEGRPVDVIADGEFIDRGVTVVVVAVSGNRVRVERATS